MSGGVSRSSAHGVCVVDAFNFPPVYPEFRFPHFREVVFDELTEFPAA